MGDIKNTKDALGKEVVFGKTYGYSKDSNGITDIVICKPVKFTASGQVSVEILKRSRALWKNIPEVLGELTVFGDKRAEKTSVKPIKLFPVNEV